MSIFIHSNLSLIAKLFEQDISGAYACVRQEASEILHCAVIDIIIGVEFAEQVTKVRSDGSIILGTTTTHNL